jgi:hypothetical protein
MLSIWDEQRAKYKDTLTVNCFIKSQSELDQEAKAKSFYDSLSAEEKKDFIEVDGKKYIRKIYERNHAVAEV